MRSEVSLRCAFRLPLVVNLLGKAAEIFEAERASVVENGLSGEQTEDLPLIADENLDLCRQYDVKGAPTLVITDGENVKTYYSVPEIKKYIASL